MSVTFAWRPPSPDTMAPTGAAALDRGLWLRGEPGRTVVLVHGLTGSPAEMKFLATFLHRRGYSVVVPRLANHGAPMAVLRRTRWQQCYQSVREVLTASDSPAASGPVFVAGLSMGALLALLLAQEFPDRIAGVSGLSPTLFYDGWNTPWYRHLLLPLCAYTPLEHFFYFKEEPPYGIKNEAIRRRVHAYYAQARLGDTDGAAQYGYPYIPATLFHEMHRLVQHLTARLPEMTMPVQLIQAVDDDITSIKNSQFIYDRVRSTVKELVLLKNSYHVVTADQERDTVVQHMDAFFNRILPGAEVLHPRAAVPATVSS